MIETISSNWLKNVTVRYGRVHCGNRMCAKMRVYDGRYHSFAAVWDATLTAARDAPLTIEGLANRAKSVEFAKDPVRMLMMLQARTPFRSSHVHVDPSINLEQYINMYEQNLIRPVRKALNSNKKARADDDKDAPLEPGAIPAERMDLCQLYMQTMSGATISRGQREAALAVAREYEQYKNVQLAKFVWKDGNLYLTPLADEHGCYCVNKRERHSHSTIYFVFFLTSKY
jgi:hypothetical protein